MQLNDKRIELQLEVLRLMRERLVQYVTGQEADFWENVWFYSDREAAMETSMLRFRIVWSQSFGEVVEQIGSSRKLLNEEFTSDEWKAVRDVYVSLLGCFMENCTVPTLTELYRRNLDAMHHGLDRLLKQSLRFDERLRNLKINQQRSRVIFQRDLERARSEP